MPDPSLIPATAQECGEDIAGVQGVSSVIRLTVAVRSWLGKHIDSDLDGVGDVCDCIPYDPLILLPVDLVPLLVHDAVDGGALLGWSAVPGADSYSVTRGSISSVAEGDYGLCLMSRITASVYEDTALPAPGEGFVYLVQGFSNDCGLGTLGFDTSETERLNTNPDACSDSPGTAAGSFD